MIINITDQSKTALNELFHDYNVIISTDLCSKLSVVNIYYNSTGFYGHFKITTDLVWKDEYHYTGFLKT